MKRLSAWNPLDHLRLLWWLLIKPQQLKAYREQFGEKAERSTAILLATTLFLLPFLLPVWAVGFEMIPVGIDSQFYLWASGWLLIPWLFMGMFGDRKVIKGLAAGLAVGVAVLAAGIVVSLTLRLTAGLAGLEGFLPLVLAELLAVGLAAGLAAELGEVSEGPLAGLLLGGMIGLGAVMGGVTEVAMGAGAVVFLAGGSVGGLASFLAIAIEKNLKTGRASFLTRAAFGLLVAVNAFLVWFSYLGGWRVF